MKKSRHQSFRRALWKNLVLVETQLLLTQTIYSVHVHGFVISLFIGKFFNFMLYIGSILITIYLPITRDVYRR